MIHNKQILQIWRRFGYMIHSISVDKTPPKTKIGSSSDFQERELNSTTRKNLNKLGFRSKNPKSSIIFLGRFFSPTRGIHENGGFTCLSLHEWLILTCWVHLGKSSFKRAKCQFICNSGFLFLQKNKSPTFNRPGCLMIEKYRAYMDTCNLVHLWWICFFGLIFFGVCMCVTSAKTK